MLARWSIPRLFTLLGAIGVMLTLGAMALSARGAYVEALETKKTTLKELVDSGVSIAQSYVERARTGAMTVPEAQKAALAALGAARFDHDNYLFVETVSAMSGIEASSEQIGRIVGVIDEIAFQTLFQLPKSFGRARQVMLWTVK
jgi:methyl-accepting chemotaxis protein